MIEAKPPLIEPLEREQRLYERVADKVLTLIKNDTWRPGDRLPPERELADAFGVSRTCLLHVHVLHPRLHVFVSDSGNTMRKTRRLR
jgi:hypothetical protein